MSAVQLTAERLRELVFYDRSTGVFRWLVSSRNTPMLGIAGNVKKALGYRQIGLGGKLYYAHRLAWFYMHSRWPAHHIDHMNGNRDDNRITNLRLATAQQNNWNRGTSRCNSTGHLGVCKPAHARRYRAQIRINGRNTHIGYFDTAKEAAAAYAAAAVELRGQFSRSPLADVVRT